MNILKPRDYIGTFMVIAYRKDALKFDQLQIDKKILEGERNKITRIERG